MRALTLIPSHWYSWDFFVTDDGRQLADFVLEHAGSVIARATKPSAFRREFVIRYKEKPYTLQAQSAFSRNYVVLDGSTEIARSLPKVCSRVRPASRCRTTGPSCSSRSRCG